MTENFCTGRISFFKAKIVLWFGKNGCFSQGTSKIVLQRKRFLAEKLRGCDECFAVDKFEENDDSV